MNDHERYQVHCARCWRRFEADTLLEAVALVEEHEKHHVARNTPPQTTMAK